MLRILTLNNISRFCNYCTSRNRNIMVDQEHVIFECPEYITSALKYPEIFSIAENNLGVFEILIINNLSHFLGDVRNIRMNSGSECKILHEVVFFLICLCGFGIWSCPRNLWFDRRL